MMNLSLLTPPKSPGTDPGNSDDRLPDYFAINTKGRGTSFCPRPFQPGPDFALKQMAPASLRWHYPVHYLDSGSKGRLTPGLLSRTDMCSTPSGHFPGLLSRTDMCSTPSGHFLCSFHVPIIMTFLSHERKGPVANYNHESRFL